MVFCVAAHLGYPVHNKIISITHHKKSKMSGRAINRTLRQLIPHRTQPQHTTSSSFRLSPSPNCNTSSSQNFLLSGATIQQQLSKRSISSTIRKQTIHTTIRTALSFELSTLRYVLLLDSEGEESLLRGWDAGVAMEDDDGT